MWFVDPLRKYVRHEREDKADDGVPRVCESRINDCGLFSG